MILAYTSGCGQQEIVRKPIPPNVTLATKPTNKIYRQLTAPEVRHLFGAKIQIVAVRHCNDGLASGAFVRFFGGVEH